VVIDVCPLEALPPGTMKLVTAGPLLTLGVYHVDGEFFALEDRCSHDDGPLVEGEWEPDDGMGRPVVICPRHGSRFDLRTGTPLTLPATQPVDTYRVWVEDAIVKVAVPD
jgi:3-phenylpropionate/trans-cinnamate dioxygenase ferredoxin component